jgi:hypothetical protein
VKSVRTQLTQTAMPYDEREENVELVLDSWVARILEKNVGKKALWRYQGPVECLEGESEAIQADLSPMLDDIEMDPEVEEEFYRQLEAMGMKPPELSKTADYAKARRGET